MQATLACFRCNFAPHLAEIVHRPGGLDKRQDGQAGRLRFSHAGITVGDYGDTSLFSRAVC